MKNREIFIMTFCFFPMTAFAADEPPKADMLRSLKDYAIFAGSDPDSSLQPLKTKSIEAFNATDSALGRQTIQFGGHSPNDIVAEKHNCMTISGGDEGGSCFQFINARGGAWTHRSGSGDTDAVNMELQSHVSSPLDVIGGGVPSADGVTYRVTFSQNTAIISPKLTAKEKLLFRSRISLFTNIAHGMASTENKDYSGSDNVDLPNYYHGYVSTLSDDENTNSTIITVENYYYPGASAPNSIQEQYIWRTILNPSPYPYARTPPWTQNIRGSAKKGDGSVRISGLLRHGETRNGRDVCRRWRCVVTGKGIPEDTIVSSSSYDDKDGSMTLGLSKTLMSDLDHNAAIKVDVMDQHNGHNFAPGNMPGDSLDNTLVYKSEDRGIVRNTNFHSYTEPALFIGQTVKDFNEYRLQTNYHPKDSISRAHDNEYDFWMNAADHDGQLESRGLTLVWQGPHRLATGSWMMRLAGFNLQPTGLWVDGVMDKGLELRSDTGLFAFKQISAEDKAIGTATPSLMLGTVGSSSRFGQLGWYASEDGGANGSFHLGLSTSRSNDMAYNVDPRCKPNDIQPHPTRCDSAGQIVFDPNGYLGGIALGVGQGATYKSGIVIDSTARVTIPNDMRMEGSVTLGGQNGSVGIKSASGERISYLKTDADGNLYTGSDRAKSGGGIHNYQYPFHGLPRAQPGTQFFCGDCYSSMRPATSAETGLIVTWNGHHWVDGVGLAIRH